MGLSNHLDPDQDKVLFNMVKHDLLDWFPVTSRHVLSTGGPNCISMGAEISRHHVIKC